MQNKLIYWVPIVGVFVSLVNYDKDNGMGALWCYYQTAVLLVLIWILAFLTAGK